MRRGKSWRSSTLDSLDVAVDATAVGVGAPAWDGVELDVAFAEVTMETLLIPGWCWGLSGEVGWMPSTASQCMVMPISVGGGMGISVVKSVLRSIFLLEEDAIAVLVVEGEEFWRHARARLMEEEWRVCRGRLVCRCIVMESRTTDVMCSSTKLFRVFFAAGFMILDYC